MNHKTRKRIEAYVADAKQMGLDVPEARIRQRARGVYRDRDRPALVQQRDLFGVAGETSPHQSPGHPLRSRSAQRRLRESHKAAGEPVFITASRHDRRHRGPGGGLEGDPLDPYTVAHALGRLKQRQIIPSEVVSVSLAQEAGRGHSSTAGPVGHILAGLGLSVPVVEVEPFLFANGWLGEVPWEDHNRVGRFDGQRSPMLILRHLPLVGDGFGIKKTRQNLQPEASMLAMEVRSEFDPGGNIYQPVELAPDLRTYVAALSQELVALTLNPAIKPGTVMVYIAPVVPNIVSVVEDGMKRLEGWVKLDGFIVVEPGSPKHVHNGSPVPPRGVSIWQRQSNLPDEGGDA